MSRTSFSPRIAAGLLSLLLVAAGPATTEKTPDPGGHLKRARASMIFGQWNDARTELDAAVRKQPNSHVPHAMRAGVRLALGDHAGVVEDVDRALALGKDAPGAWLPSAHLTKAAALERLKRPAAALVAVDAGLALETRAGGVALRAKILFDLGRKGEALAEARRARSLKPDGEALSTLAVVFLLSGEDEEGCDAVNEACALGRCALQKEFSECVPAEAAGLAEDEADPFEQMREAFLASKDPAVLIEAIEKADLGQVRELLAKGFSADGGGSGGRLPLVVAAGWGHRDIVALLLDHKANVQAKDASGFTPLFAAVNNRREAVVELLLQRGADPNAGIPEMTPLQNAQAGGNARILELLKKHGAR